MSTTPAPSMPRSESATVVLYARLVKFASSLQSPFLLLIRLVIGYQCMMAGYRHLTHFENTVNAFRGWNIPMPHVNVAIAAVTELIGGAMLLLGLAARLISIPLVINFIVAILAVNLSDPEYNPLIKTFWKHQDVIIKDDAFPFLFTALLILIFGPGSFSIDGIVKYIRSKK